MQTAWAATPPVARKTLYFSDLQVRESFSIASPQSKGAVYTKVYNPREEVYYMLELETGSLFPPTSSPVRREDVRLKVVSKRKPSIYAR